MKTIKKIVFLWAMLVCYFNGFSQVLTVKDNTTKKPIDMVYVISEEPEAATYTNSRGEAEISEFKGSTEIHFQIIGYKKIVLSYAQLEAKGFLVYLIRDGYTTEKVVVSVNKRQQAQSEIPIRVSSLSLKDLTLENPQTTADLLGSTGEVFIQKSQQGGGSPMIRGFATNRLLYSIDGVRMNTAIFRGGNIQNIISLDPFALGGTEVLFGPGSVIYGSDAIGGVMSFTTLNPELSVTDSPLVRGNAVYRVATANQEKTGHFDIQMGWKKWALLSSVSFNNYGDLTMGSHGPEEYLRPFHVKRVDSMDVVETNGDPKVQNPSGFTQINMMQKVRFKPNKKWDFTYGFHYSETSKYDRYDRHIRYKDGQPRYGEWYYGPQKWMMNHVKAEYENKSKWFNKMTINLAHQFFEESRISRDFNKNNRETRVEKVDALSANVDFFKYINKKNKVYYGVEMVRNDIRSTGLDEDISTGLESTGPSRYPESNWSSYAVYLTHQYKFSKKVLLHSGIRYNVVQLNAQFDTSFYPFPITETNMENSAVTGSLGLVVKPNSQWILSTNLSTAFRSPNIDDMGKVFDSEPGAVVVPNTNLNAEYAYNMDLSIAKKFGKYLTIDATGFYTLLDNALVRRDFTLNGQDSLMYDGELSKVQAIQNAAVANVYGVQFGMEFNHPSGFGLVARYNVQIGEEEQDDGTTSPSRHAAPAFGLAKIKYNKGDLGMEFYAQFSDGKTFDELPVTEQEKDYLYAIDENGNPYSPSWYTLNFKARYKISSSLFVSAGLENITDQRYRTYSSGISAAGRNVILSLSSRF